MNRPFLLLPFIGAVLPASALEKPNVLFIIGDDVGYGDLSCYGAEKISTHHLDRLAARGCRFTDAHSAAATSSPARYALLTGTHGFRNGIDILPGDAAMALPTDRITLPRLFRQVGYRTAVVGKWHLGLGPGGRETDWNRKIEPSPSDVGFDYSFILPATNDRVPCVYVENGYVVNADPADPITVDYKQPIPGSLYPVGHRNPDSMSGYPSSHGHNMSVINGIGRIGYMKGGQKALWKDETIADTLVEHAVDFIRENRDRPFFLMFNSNDIHVPRVPHPRFRGTSDYGLRGDAMVQLDWCAGVLMDLLDELGLTSDTIIVFSSDNGPVYDDGYRDGTTVHLFSRETDNGHDASGPYFGGKYDIREGGTRVPLLIAWENHVRAGSVSEALVSQVDFLGTFASYFGIPLNDNEALDSVDSFPSFFGNHTELDPDFFLIEEAVGKLALRYGNRKIRDDKNRRLYGFDTDFKERKSFYFNEKEKYWQMRKMLDELKKTGRRFFPKKSL